MPHAETMRSNPIPLATQQMVIEHHGRMAAVEVEAREARADAADLRADIAGLRMDVREIAEVVKPLAAVAAAAHQQTSTLLTYLFGACLAIAGGSVSAWLTGLAHLSGAAQVGVAAGAALACVFVANLAIAHARR